MQNPPENISPASHTAGHLNRQDRTVYMLRPVAGGRKGEGENIWYATVYGGATTSEAELDANAHRLQLCWNACEGIPSDKLDKQNKPNAAVAAIKFALERKFECPIELLQCWLHGDFDSIRREWPDAPEDIFIGADPLATGSLIEKSTDLATEIDLLKSKVLELEKFQKAVNELQQFFTSHNGVPVDKATIKAEDFWRIIGQSDTAAHPRKFEIEKELLGVIKQFVKIYGDGEVEEQDEDEEVPNQWYDEQCEAAMRNARAVLKKYEPQI